MTLKEMIRLVYGVVMGTSTPYLKPSKRFLFPTAMVAIDSQLNLFMGGSGICGVLREGSERLVINLNRGLAAEKLREFLSAQAAARPITREVVVLNSLEHDFSEGLALFSQATEVWIGPADERTLRRELGDLVERSRVVRTEVSFEAAGEQVLLIPMGPAATQTDLAVYLKNRSILFLGPLFFNGVHPILHSNDSSRGLDLKRWLEQTEALIERLQPKTVVPAEGDTGGMEELRNFLNYLRALSDKDVEFSYCRQNFDWLEIPGQTSLEENFDLLRANLKTHTSLGHH